MADEPICPVHGEALRDEAEWATDRADPDAFLIRALHFPHAASSIHLDAQGTRRELYCPTCREAEASWIAAPGDWTAKSVWMRLGYDPFLNRPVRVRDAVLVTDYVWIERWIRTLEAAGLLGYVADVRRPGSLDEYIASEVSIARAEGAPLDATHRSAGRWWTLEETEGELLRGALGLDPFRG